MWMKIRILISLVLLTVFAAAQPLTLLTPVSSKMPTGSEFRAVDGSGRVYAGTLITRPARRFLRRGSVLLRFYEPMHVVTNDPEGVIRAGRKKQVILLGTTPLIAKIADDSVDGAIGGGKARFVALGASILFMALVKGGEVHLKPGDKLEVEAGRWPK
jgi:hypothetical protein